MSKLPRSYIDHIIIEIDFLQRSRNGKTEEDFANDEMMQRAFARSIEIIGEAVKNLDDDLKAKHTDIEWRKISWMRDKLIHNYFGIDYTLVWNVVMEKIDPFKEQLIQIKQGLK